MTKTQQKATAKTAPVKPKSPVKKEKNYIVRKKGKAIPKLTVISFGEPFTFEVYMFTKDAGNDGFTHHLARYIRHGSEEGREFPAVDACNFTEVLDRRVPGSNDMVMENDSNQITRLLFLSYPTRGESTKITRNAGLAALDGFFKDPRNTKWPPAIIEKEDLTGQAGIAMDRYMLNSDIKERLIEDLVEDDLNTRFVEKYPECAARCWANDRYVGEWATDLGFGQRRNHDD